MVHALLHARPLQLIFIALILFEVIALNLMRLVVVY